MKTQTTNLAHEFFRAAMSHSAQTVKAIAKGNARLARENATAACTFVRWAEASLGSALEPEETL